MNLLCAGVSVDGDGRIELSWRALVDVSLVEESGKEDKVRKVHEQRQFDVLLADVARFAVLFQLISPQVDGASSHHLRKLRYRNGHRDETRDSIVHRLEGIVRVHGRVHCKVHSNEPARRSRVFCKRIPRIDQNGGMMVPMKED